MSKTRIINMDININKRVLLVSDIHGSLNLLKDALLKAKFSDRDYLFILGDVIEKGTESLKTLRFVMELCKKDNVFMILGNCDEVLNRMFELTDLRRMKKYILKVKNTIFREFADEINFKIDENSDLEDFKNKLEANFKPELDFINNLPHIIILNNHLVLVHAGIEDLDNPPLDSWDVMKNDYFLDRSPVQKKLTIVGHCPSVNYSHTYIWCNPIRNFQKNIITIDGGNNVINRGGQLNVLIIDKMKEINIDYIHVDNLPKIEVKKDIIVHNSNSYNVTFHDSLVRVIKPEGDFYLVEHVSTGNQIYAVREEERKIGEEYNVCDATNYFIPLQKGEIISLVLKAEPYSVIKNNGIIGLANTKDLF